MTESDRATWKEHPNAAGPASMLLFIHDHFRATSERLRSLVAGGADATTLAREFRPLAEVLHHHHHAEELMLFPAILRATGVAPERLVEDHVELMGAIDDVNASFTRTSTRERIEAALARFDDVLRAHLDREEELVVPVLLAMTPAEANRLIHGGPP
jgi:iron-sulfur cluster repair protein YtfE (RIC family)